jgi:O-antigen/teichoic acid export membrane protein
MINSLLDRSVKHTVWNTFGSIGTLIVSIAFAGVALRYLGTARYGFVMLMQSVTGIIIDVGLGQAAIYYVARYYRDGETERIKNILGVVILGTVVIGIVVALVLVFCVNPILIWAKLPIEYAEDAKTAVFIYAINFSIIYGFGVLRIVPQAIERFDWFNITNLAQSMGGGMLNLIILLIWPTITALMLSMLITTVLTRTILFIKAKGWLGFWIFPRWNRSEARNLWSFGKAVALNQAGGLMANTVGQWILTSYLGSSALPYFVIPRNIAQRVHSLLAGQANFIFPMLSSESSERSVESLYAIYDKLQWLAVSCSALIYMLLFVLASPILTIWLGEEFAQFGILPWQICMVPYFFLAMNIVPYYVTYSIKRPMANTVSAMVFGFGSVILSILLIPKYGVVGAVFSLWIAIPVGTIYAMWVGKAILPNIGWKRLFAPYAGSVILVVSIALCSITANIVSETVMQHLFFITGSLIIAGSGIWFYETRIDSSSLRLDTLKRAAKQLIG